MTTAEQLLSLKERLVAYQAAEIAILKNQSYTIKDMTYERANLQTVKDTIRDLSSQIATLERGGIFVQLAIPRSS